MLELFQPDARVRGARGLPRRRALGPGGASSRTLFLGYGLSQTIRRDSGAVSARAVPACRSSPAACATRRPARSRPSNRLLLDSVPHRAVGEHVGRPRTTSSAVEDVRAAIARGDVYQVNLVRHLSAPFAGDPGALVGALAPLRPLHGRALAGRAGRSSRPRRSASSRAAAAASGRVRSRGRGRRGSPVEGAKDAAEHVMIVDLERNDLSRVCEPGSVRWPELMAERELAGVTHLVSTVEGTLREDATLADLLAATFPGGSVTGAPKIAAVDLIAALEPVGRGASMGALGTVRPNGDLDLALTIRTFAVADGRIHLWVGGGIVWDSEPGGRAGRDAREGGAAARRARRAAPRARRTRDAARARRDRARRRRPRRARPPCRRRGAPARPRRVRDAARLRRPPVPARRAPRPARGVVGADRARADPARRARGARRRRRSRRRASRTSCCASSGRPAARAARRSGSRSSARSRPGSRRRAARGVRLVSLLGARAAAPWLLGGVKSTSYAVNMAAEAEAKRRGADDAVFVDHEGVVLECPVSNIWWRAWDDPRHPVVRARDPRRRHARRRARARAAARLRGRGGHVPARRAARRRRGVHLVVGARDPAGSRAWTGRRSRSATPLRRCRPHCARSPPR